MNKLTWKGDVLKSKAARASALAIDATMSACIQHAKGSHGAGAHGAQRFVSQSSELERGIRIVQPAQSTKHGVAGRWGTIGVVYARRIELGFQGRDSAGRAVDAAPFPYLRPAAQTEYPKLASRLARAFSHA